MAISVSHIFTSPIADGTNTDLVRPSNWNSAHTVDMAVVERIGVSGGNTIGDTGLSYGSVYLQGGNNVTLSQITAAGSKATVIFSGANAGGAQTAISGVIVSDATYTSGTVSFSNQNNITIGSSVNGATQYIRLSVGNYLTTAMASNRGSDFVAATAAFAGTSASGTIASDGISVSIGPYITTADLSANSSKYNQNWKLTGNTGGTTSSAQGTDVWYEGGNSITVSGNSNTIKFSVGAYITTADLSANSSKYFINWKLTGNTANTTSSAQGTDFWLEGGNSITVLGTSNTVKFSVGNYLTTARGSTDALGLNTAGTNMTWTANSSGLSINAGGYAGTNTTMTGGSVTLNTSGISINLPAYITTADLSANSSKYFINWKLTGNTANTTSSAQGTDFWLEGGNSITVLGTSNTVKFSVGNYITTADLSANSSKYFINWKLTGNTANTTSSAQGTDFWLEGGNSITVLGTSNTVKFSVGNYITTAMASNRGTDFVQATAVFNGTNASGTIASGAISVSVAAPGAAAEANAINLLGANTAGNTTATGSTIGWSGLNATLSGANNSQVVISVPATSSIVGSSGISLSSAGSTISIYQPVASEYDPFPGQQPVTNSVLGLSTLYFYPFEVEHMVSASRVNFFHSLAFSYSGVVPTNASCKLAGGYGLYTRMTGTGTDRISLLTSYSMDYFSGIASSSTRLSVTNYWQVSNGTTHSTTQYGVNDVTAGTYLSSSIGGYRVLAYPMSTLLTPGRYWMGYSVQNAASTNSFSLAHTVLQYLFSNNIAFRPFNVTTVASNGSNWGANVGAGVYTGQSAAWPVSIALTTTAISLAPIITVPMFNFSGISQSSNVL